MEIGMRLRFIVTLAEQIKVQKDTEQVIEQVTEPVSRILNCLKNEPLGARDAMQSLGLRHRPTFLYDYLQPAMDAGFVEMTQPESPKSPTQKYRLTAKGKAALLESSQLESGK
ncbi:MAG: helix-turn-helix transcriptional regulator [Desulfobacteraceae bacterium]|nr:helix-turn-helix transcriptional regulator [Desulfobacteraceae bacterium]